MLFSKSWCEMELFRNSVLSFLLALLPIVFSVSSAYGCPDIDGLADLNCDGSLVIVCFGDSITRGEQDSTGLGYPGRLRQSYFPSAKTHIVNLGNSGEKTSRGRSRAAREFTRYSNADYAIVLEGVNDYFETSRSSYNTKQNLLSIERASRNAGALTLIANLTDVRRAFQHPWVVAVNQQLRSYRDLDFYSLGTAIISSDKLHPNGNGYQRMAETAAATLIREANDHRPADADADGIYDFAEGRFGTIAGNSDSDGDGLLDGAEVFTYLTNPLTSDSDGDGFSDHDEVSVRNTDPNSTVPAAATITDLVPVIQ